MIIPIKKNGSAVVRTPTQEGGKLGMITRLGQICDLKTDNYGDWLCVCQGREL